MHTTARVIKITITAVVVVVLIMLLLWKLSDNKPLLPDRAPATIDQNAVINDDDGEKLTPPPGGGATSFNYAKEVSIDLSTGTAALYFKNSSKSIYDASILLVVQDTVIFESGLLPPGSALTSLVISKGDIPLQQGGYNGEIWVQFYDESGNALTVNSQLQGIAVEVK